MEGRQKEAGVMRDKKGEKMRERIMVALAGIYHREADQVAIYFPREDKLLRLLRPLGIRWSKTYRCWYGPLNIVWLARLEEAIQPVADIDRSALDAYIAGLPEQERVREEVSAAVKYQEKAEGGLPEIIHRARRGEGRSAIQEVNKAAYRAMEQALVLKGYSPHTCRTYLNEICQFFVALRGHEAASFSVQRIKDYLEYCFVTLKLTEHTIHSRMNALKFYYEQVLGQEKMLLDIPRPKRPMELPKLLNEDELARLFNSLRNRKHKALLFTVYSAGLRVSEVVKLKIADIDSQRMQLLVERAKGKKDRYVNLSPVLLDILREYIKTYLPRPRVYLFESDQGGGPYPIRTVQQIFGNARRKAGISKEVGIHSLRHSFATHLLDKGVDIRYIKDLLGHFNIKTTERYLHVSKKQLVNIISPFDDLMKKGGISW